MPHWASVRIRTHRGTSLGNAPRITGLAAERLLLTAYLACWRVLDAGVLDFEPVALDRLTVATCRAVGFFFPSLGAAVVDGAASCFGLRGVGAGDDLRGRRGVGASLDAWVDLARNGLALGEGCSTVNEEGAVDWHPIRPRTSITSRLNILTP